VAVAYFRKGPFQGAVIFCWDLVAGETGTAALVAAWAD